MCGIFGIVAPQVDQAFLEKCTATLAHRGPDDAGYHRDEHVGLGHRRLSIIDLEGGHQPIFNEDGSKCIVCNGEIYNYRELRDELVGKGHRFSTRSDSEVALHAYEEWGEESVERLRGMFALAIWDLREQALFLVRDRLGIKPFFFGEDSGRFYFASEMKAILEDPRFPRDVDDVALASYFNLSYIPSGLTIYKKIRKLLPGHTLRYQNGKATIRKYWDLQMVPNPTKSEAQFEQGFMHLLQEAVDLRLISEVPLGAFLSGGIDSSLIVALMSQVSAAPVSTFCMGFGGDAGGYLDERQYARQVSARYATKHREFTVQPTVEGLIEKIVDSFDEPFADDSAIPSYYVCKLAREDVTVALSGLGGDEVFSGYERHLGFVLNGQYRRLPTLVRERLIRPMVERLPERADGHYTINHMKRFVRSESLPADQRYYEYISRISPRLKRSFFSEAERFDPHFDECRSIVLGHFNSENVQDAEDSLNRALYCDIKSYLPEDILAVTDRLSMHHALEVRVPFLDHKFMEYCATIPADMKIKWFKKKHLLRNAARRYLPADVINHRKQGFVGPMARWLQHDLKSHVQETLSEGNLDKHGYLNPATVRTILDEHFSGREIHDTLIWSMLIFQTWFNRYIVRE